MLFCVFKAADPATCFSPNVPPRRSRYIPEVTPTSVTLKYFTLVVPIIIHARPPFVKPLCESAVFAYSRSRFSARKDGSSINSLGVTPKPFASIITVFSEMPVVRRCIMLFIVGNGILLSCDNLY